MAAHPVYRIDGDLVHHPLWHNVMISLEMNPELKAAYKGEDIVRRIIDNGRILEGLARNASTHAAGVVIGAEPLTERDRNAFDLHHLFQGTIRADGNCIPQV